MADVGFHLPRQRPYPGCGFVVARAFDHGDLPFLAGDPFPYRDLGMHEITAGQLWTACYLDVAPPADPVRKTKRR